MIRIEGVTHVYGRGEAARTVLADIDLHLDESRIGIVGANGSGKSTLARLVNGLVIPTRGRVLVGGLDTARDGRAVRREVGFCFTNPDAQIVMPTVAEDVAFGLRRRGLSKAEIAERVDAALDEAGLAAHRDHPAHQLSGGQKQLLALASVLVTRPRIVVLDEPTTLLDARNARAFARRLDDLAQQVILVTHDLESLTDFERVVVIDEGRVVADGAPRTALAAYRALTK